MRSSRLLTLACCVSSLASSPLTSQETPQPITLAEAVRLAQRNAPASVQALGSVRMAKASTTSALSAFLPRISINAGVNKAEGAVFRQGAYDQFTGWSQGRGYNAGMLLF